MNCVVYAGGAADREVIQVCVSVLVCVWPGVSWGGRHGCIAAPAAPPARPACCALPRHPPMQPFYLAFLHLPARIPASLPAPLPPAPRPLLRLHRRRRAAAARPRRQAQRRAQLLRDGAEGQIALHGAAGRGCRGLVAVRLCGCSRAIRSLWAVVPRSYAGDSCLATPRGQLPALGPAPAALPGLPASPLPPPLPCPPSQAITWQAVIIDEAHRMKSTASSTRAVIASMPHDWLLLLTGGRQAGPGPLPSAPSPPSPPSPACRARC